MATITRSDGVQFSLLSYRELLARKNVLQLKQELRSIAQTNGQFARLFKKPGKRIEAVFSRDPGYLFGETVWQYFGKPDNLIFAEALPETDNILVVIVADGVIHLDTQISANEMRQELLSLTAGEARFSIKVYGEAPLAEIEAAYQFVLDEAHVRSFTILTEPVFDQLPLDPELKLLGIEQAIQVARLNQYVPYAALGGLALAVMLIIWLIPKPTLAPNKPLLSPVQRFQQALNGPAPSAQLLDLSDRVKQSMGVAGWMPTSIKVSGAGVKMLYHSLGATTENLYRWAKQAKSQMRLTSRGAQVAFPNTVPLRAKPLAIFKTQRVLSALIDRAMQIIPGKSVSIGQITTYPIYHEAQVTITLNAISADVIALLGRALQNLPINLRDGEFSLEHGLLSGKLNLTVIGN